MKINLLNFKTMKTIKFYVMAVIAISLLASCNNDDDATIPPVEEEEAITKLILTFTNVSNSSDVVTLTWDDANMDEVIDAGEQTVTGPFSAGQTYNAVIALEADGEDFLAEDILENQEAIDAHFFVYTVNPTNLFSMMTRTDATTATRSDGNKLGVNTTWTVGSTSGTGTITIQLWHEATTVSDTGGFGSATGDETDIDIPFNITIQ